MALGFQRSRALFNQLDTNHDHLIDIGEFLAQAQQLGLDGSLDLQEVFEAADLDHSANIGATGHLHCQAQQAGSIQHYMPMCYLRQPPAARPTRTTCSCHTWGMTKCSRASCNHSDS
jgi:hypothetical protein